MAESRERLAAARNWRTPCRLSSTNETGKMNYAPEMLGKDTYNVCLIFHVGERSRGLSFGIFARAIRNFGDD